MISSAALGFLAMLTTVNVAEGVLPEEAIMSESLSFEEQHRLWFGQGIWFVARGDDLEGIHCLSQASLDSSQTESHQAMFMLSQCLLRHSRLDEFEAAARRVRTWPDSPYTRHMALQHTLVSSDPEAASWLVAGDEQGHLLAAQIFLEHNLAERAMLTVGEHPSQLASWLRGLAQQMLGASPLEAWTQVLQSEEVGETADHLRTLAAVQLRTLVPEDKLQVEPSHLQMADEPGGSSRREPYLDLDEALAAGSRALDQRDHAAGRNAYAAADSLWLSQAAELESIVQDPRVGPEFEHLSREYWDYSQGGVHPGWRNLRTLEPSLDFSDFPLTGPRGSRLPELNRTESAAWQSMQDSVARLWGKSQAAGQAWVEAEAELKRWMRFLNQGDVLADVERAHMDSWSNVLYGWAEDADALDSLLRTSVVEATHRMEAQARIQRTWARLNGLRAEGTEELLGLDDDYRSREGWPLGVPTPTDLAALESTFSNSLRSYLTQFLEVCPGELLLLAATVWGPEFAGSFRELDSALQENRRQLDAFSSDVAGQKVAAQADLGLARFKELHSRRREELAQGLERYKETRRELVQQAARRALKAHHSQREAVDYGLMATAYQNRDNMHLAPARDEAIELHRRFLELYPESIARSEARYRLADLLLVKAREQFQAEMTQYLEAPDGYSAPSLEVGRALDLYRAILQEDPYYLHTDATLFFAGTILTDIGDRETVAEGEGYLRSLVSKYPESEFVHFAWLTLGDLAFGRKDFAGSIRAYESASRGGDAEHQAVSWYKLGWSYYQTDQFASAVDAFLTLADLDSAAANVPTKVGLGEEGREYLVRSIMEAGGSSWIVQHKPGILEHNTGRELLLELSALQEENGRFHDASATDLLFLESFPLDARCLDAAIHHLAMLTHSQDRSTVTRDGLRFSSRFQIGSDWSKAHHDSLQNRGELFAQECVYAAAVVAWESARDLQSDWQDVMDLAQRWLFLWPDHARSLEMRFALGEAASALKSPAAAMEAYLAVAQASLPGVEPDMISESVWRAAGIAGELDSSGALYTHTRPDLADSLWLVYVERWPHHDRALQGLILRADLQYALSHFDAAADAYQLAAGLTLKAGQDSLSAVLNQAVPECRYRHAESLAETGNSEEIENQYVRVADLHPEYVYAPRALFLAGHEARDRGRNRKAVSIWERLASAYTGHELAVEALLLRAETLEIEDPVSGAEAYLSFSGQYPDLPRGRQAMLRAVEIKDAHSISTLADKNDYIKRYPHDAPVVMEYSADLARHELLPSLIEETPQPGSQAVGYLGLAETHPQLADSELVGRIRFAQGEAIDRQYRTIRLTQPLDASLSVKRDALDNVLAAYQKSLAAGSVQWSRASAYRMGECLVHFGESIRDVPPPETLSEEDVDAYQAVLEEQAWSFFDQGEAMWLEILDDMAAGRAAADPGEWVEQTRQALWPRLADRFLFRPEVEYPVIDAEGPGPKLVAENEQGKETGHDR